MSNLKKIKDKIYTVSKCKIMCESMYNLSSIKIVKLKHQQKKKEEELNYLGNILSYLNIELFDKKSEKISFLFFSDFGFCGDFNNYDLEKLKQEKGNIISIGKKSNGNIDNCLTSNFEIFKKQIYSKVEKSKNFEFIIKNYTSVNNFELHFSSFIKPNLNLQKLSFYKSVDKEAIKNLYLNLFLEYVFFLGNLHENYYRSLIMKNAVENSKEWQKSLTINLNKVRQNAITNEILLIISGQQQEGN